MTFFQPRTRVLAVLVTALALAGCGQQGPTGSSAAKTTTAATPVTSTASPSVSPRTSESPSEQPVDCAKVKCVALTFDDGPGPLTPTLLKTLVKEKVPATFFLVGQMVKAYPDTAKQIAATPGMTVANHSMSHPNLRLIAPAKAAAEITENTKLIEKVTGVKMRYFRPPYGSHNTATDAVAKKLGQSVVLWSAGALDWQYNTPAKIIEVTMPQMAPGAVVLAHDIHPWTVKAVPTLIKKLRAAGYTLVSLDDILGKVAPGKTYSRGEH